MAERDRAADRIARRQRFRGIWLPAVLVDPFGRCPHDCQRGIYGDKILAAMRPWSGRTSRARCLDCGRLLPNLPEKGQVCRHGDILR